MATVLLSIKKYEYMLLSSSGNQLDSSELSVYKFKRQNLWNYVLKNDLTNLVFQVDSLTLTPQRYP